MKERRTDNKNIKQLNDELQIYNTGNGKVSIQIEQSSFYDLQSVDAILHYVKYYQKPSMQMEGFYEANI